MPRKAPGAKAKGLGAQLRVCRENAGLNLRQAAEAVDWDKSTLSRLETGKRNFTVEEVAHLLGVYRVRGALREELLAIARTIDEPGWWDQGLQGLPKESAILAEYESQADRITDWAPLLIPGLLQTMDYSRAWLLSVGADPATVELLLTARLRRQQILHGDVRYVAFVGESALRTPVGDAATSARQLATLREVGKRRNVSIRVVPSAAGPHRGQLGSFLAMEFASAPPVVLVELLRSSVFMDEDKQTGPYLATAAHLAGVALGETESARLIARIQARWSSHDGTEDLA
ncbi:helix-turn-helix domain-containing protein [Amycolatopsis aidingensis]|uniref:helix-turn-helix domain-containing protein n=1 Tax=Amycolatopsis aidingensis TaxID=2842453 RepID=UPI001C0B80B9|nr:helix-turn-helix transcriptional regulator [Amycolatopsis aidingensis]